MRKLTILALSALLIMATAGLAVACDGKAEAKTASAEACASKGATAETASAEACASKGATAETASAEGCATKGAAATTASAEGCATKGAAATTASAEGCATGASATTASATCASGATAKTAGAGCASGASASAEDCAKNASAHVSVETVRMPSGTLAVFYNGKTAETVAFLQAAAAKGTSEFACGIVKGMASDEMCSAEMAATDTGVMVLVSSKDETILNKYEQQYAAMTETGDEEQSE